MQSAIQFVGSDSALQIFGIRLFGVNAQNGQRLLFSIVLLSFLYACSRFGTALSRKGGDDLRRRNVSFWIGQVVSISVTLVGLIGLVSIWFDDPKRLTTAVGLITAGLAFALQQVITSFAGYLLILRGNTFSVGDRITMGGIRGDVIALHFFQTIIMEMGQPPSVQGGEPGMWVESRQYTGRIVSVTNSKIFDQPVYNYTRDFPFIWEEMHIPIKYTADREKAESIMLDAANQHTMKTSELTEEVLLELEHRYFLPRTDLHPRVYYRLTDNWLELTVRFIVRDHGIRVIKDKISRDIIKAFDQASIEVASSTYDIVGLPPLRVESSPSRTSSS